MNIREQKELREHKQLSPYACRVTESAGRKYPNVKCEIRTDYERDRDRIIHADSFRRLKHKTQVFISPQSDHNRTRLTHTLEVSQISRTLARALALNEDLTEAIALGHDLGHTPFGHAGEKILNEICPFEFRHNEQSVRVVTIIEKHGRGLNLTKEVIDGIRTHSQGLEPKTLEAWVVYYSDKIAYINHDIDDAIRFGVLTEGDLPKVFTKVLGNRKSDRINTLISDIINESMGKNHIRMSEEVYEAFMGLRDFLFENVYHSRLSTDAGKKGEMIVQSLYEYYLKHLDMIPKDFRERIEEFGSERCVCDYVACMSDVYAINRYQELFLPDLQLGM